MTSNRDHLLLGKDSDKDKNCVRDKTLEKQVITDA